MFTPLTIQTSLRHWLWCWLCCICLLAQLLHQDQGAGSLEVELCVLSLSATCDAGRLALANIVSHFCLSLGPCFTL